MPRRRWHVYEVCGWSSIYKLFVGFSPRKQVSVVEVALRFRVAGRNVWVFVHGRDPVQGNSIVV